jgi:threonine synthase
MKLCSTRNPQTQVTWREAVLSGLAPDGGLYVPESLPQFSAAEIERLHGRSFSDVAAHLATRFLQDELDSTTITKICHDSLNFECPLTPLDSSTLILELFHGPTCAFKDFGARFMALLFRHFWGTQSSQLTVLVATSGDTGSAVANAFFDTTPNPPIRVAILYPKNKVSEVQRRQMTTLGHNITAFEVDGSFDDCQALVKRTLQDKQVHKERSYTSANSINIARLLPQMFYYAYATLLVPRETPPTFIVPSGNLGNVTGAILSHMCGFTFSHCVAACNSNSTFPDFLSTGIFKPRHSQETISNAMDVGAPSNFFRINSLMGAPDEQSLVAPRAQQMQALCAYSISDELTKEAIKAYYSASRYILDPHTAVGAAALTRFRNDHPTVKGPYILAATAHPAKFSDVVEGTLGIRPPLPPQLAAVLHKPESFISISTSYPELISHLVK